jgi:hypothetical protein
MVYNLVLHFIALTRDGNDYVNFKHSSSRYAKKLSRANNVTSDVLTRSMTES